MAYLSPEAIFSPSVAKQQLAAAKDWNYIDDWLSVKFQGKKPPSFERNNDTLKALLALATFNDSADEENGLLKRVETKTLEELEAAETQEPHIDLINMLEQSLSREGKLGLEALSNLSVVLNQPIPKIDRLGRSLIDLQVICNNLDHTNDRINSLETHLNYELENVDKLTQELQSQAYQPILDPAKQATHYQRKLKEMSNKIPELRERVTLLSTSVGQPTTTLHDIISEETKFKNLLTVVRELEEKVKGFHNLPHDKNLARLELEAVKVELHNLSRKRDDMFENLVQK